MSGTSPWSSRGTTPSPHETSPDTHICIYIIKRRPPVVFLLDRATGAPLFPVEERPVPQSDVPGEQTWPTQPFPTKPPPLVPQRLTEADLWDVNPDRLEKCRKQLRALRNEGIYTPPSERGSILYPSSSGANWSGAAFDPTSGLLVVPVNNWVHTIRLKKLPPSNVEQTDGIVMRPRLSLLWWLLTGRGTGLCYAMLREEFFEDGIPCHEPPWGPLVAVDLHRGEIVCQVPVGETESGVRSLFNYSPPLVTAGGLVFQGNRTVQAGCGRSPAMGPARATTAHRSAREMGYGCVLYRV